MKNNIRIFIVLGLVFGFISGTALGTIKLGTDDSGQGWFGDDTGLIVCSNGKSFPATQIGLQAAIYSLNSTNGGWVEVPVCNITFTTTLFITSGVWLRGSGNGTIFYLANNINKTMIENKDKVNGNSDISLSYFNMKGNGLNQPEWWSSTNQ